VDTCSNSTTTNTSIVEIDSQNKIHRKIEETAAGLANAWTNNLLSLPEEIATVIVDYIKVMKSEQTGLQKNIGEENTSWIKLQNMLIL
jgi:hypothetical protein